MVRFEPQTSCVQSHRLASFAKTTDHNSLQRNSSHVFKQQKRSLIARSGFFLWPQRPECFLSIMDEKFRLRNFNGIVFVASEWSSVTTVSAAKMLETSAATPNNVSFAVEWINLERNNRQPHTNTQTNKQTNKLTFTFTYKHPSTLIYKCSNTQIH